MPFIQVNGLNMYYEIAGQGPRLLFINITGGDLRQRPGIFQSPLAGRFQILGFDQRGLGQTGKPDQPYSMAGYADDAAGLMEALGWERAAVLGVSFGGMVAQELALRHPGRVGRLALACTSSGGAGGASYPLHELAGLRLEERAQRMVGLLDTRRDAAWRAAHPQEFQALAEQNLARFRLGAEEPGRAVGARRQLEARVGHDTHDRLAGLDLPVQVCGGLFDGVAAPERLVALAQAIPGARLEFFQGGHQFLVQDPRAYGRVGDFLLGKPAGGPALEAGCFLEGWDPETLLPLAAGQAAVSLSVLDLAGRLVFYNQHAPRILDRRPEYLGRDVRELHRPASSAKITAILESYAQGSLREHHWRLKREDREFAVRVAPLIRDGRCLGLVHAVMRL